MLRTFNIAFFLAFKSLKKSNRPTIVLMISILSLAFINLVFISGILGGILVAMDKQVRTNVVSNVVIEPQEEPVKKDFIIHAKELQRQIEQIPGVVATARRYKMAGTIAYDKKKNGKFAYRSAEIAGVDPEAEKNMSDISRKILEGRYLEGLGTGDIVIGSEIVGGYGGDELNSLGGAKVGEKIKITFSNGITRDYTIRGIFKINFGFADRLAFITIKEAESLLPVYDNASQILVKTATTGDEVRYIEQIKPLAPNLKIKKFRDYMGPLADVSKSFDIITFMISIIGLVVAAITIFILIYVNAVHKRRQIGILKAIGIGQNIIICSYIFQALFYAISGIVIGALLVFYVIAPYFAKHPLDLPVGESSLALNITGIIQNVVSLLIAAFIAGLIPSRQAAKENILKAIWGI